MQPAKRDLVITCGDSFGAESVSFIWSENGVPVDLTGYTGSMRASMDAPDGADIFDWTDSNGMLILGGPLGSITPDVDPATTAALWPPAKVKPGTAAAGVPTYKAGIWILELTAPDGTVRRPLQGDLLLIQKVQKVQ